MKAKKIDLSPFMEKPTEELLRRILFKDHDLMVLLAIISNEEAISIPQLKTIYNSSFSKDKERGWFYHKLGKVSIFNIIDKQSYGESCNQHQKKSSDLIKEKHLKWVSSLPHQFHFLYQTSQYLFLTDDGEKIMDYVNEQLKRRAKELNEH